MKEESRDDLSKALDGDSAAFGRLLDPLIGPAYRLAVTILGDRSEAEDAVQDAAVIAWRKLGNVRPGADLKPWFLGVVTNRCRSAVKRPWWRVLRLPEVRNAPTQPGRDLETRIDLTAAFDRLTHEQRRVLALFYGLDPTLAELATTLGCTESAAKARLYRAVAALRPHLSIEEARA